MTANGDRLAKIPAPVRDAVHALLQELWAAHVVAHDFSCEPWNFALELSALRGVQTGHSALRWLIGRGLVAQRVERTVNSDAARSFEAVCPLTLPERSCFLLTTEGLLLARQILEAGGHCRSDEGIERPRWDGNGRQLWVGNVLVKAFTQPSDNQRLILDAFQEAGWPKLIDDPLPPLKDSNQPKRLRDTVGRLNHCQRHQLLFFRVGNSGESISWELLAASSETPALWRLESPEGDVSTGQSNGVVRAASEPRQSRG
jgi:hypothetical protein